MLWPPKGVERKIKGNAPPRGSCVLQENCVETQHMQNAAKFFSAKLQKRKTFIPKNFRLFAIINEQKYRLLQCVSSTEKTSTLVVICYNTHLYRRTSCLFAINNERKYPPPPPPKPPPCHNVIIHRRTSTLVVICYNTHLYRRTSCLFAINNERKYPPPPPPQNPPLSQCDHPPKNINFGCNLLQHTSVPKNILSVCNQQRTKISPPHPPPPKPPPCHNVNHPPKNINFGCNLLQHTSVPKKIQSVCNPQRTKISPPHPPHPMPRQSTKHYYFSPTSSVVATNNERE